MSDIKEVLKCIFHDYNLNTSELYYTAELERNHNVSYKSQKSVFKFFEIKKYYNDKTQILVKFQPDIFNFYDDRIFQLPPFAITMIITPNNILRQKNRNSPVYDFAGFMQNENVQEVKRYNILFDNMMESLSGVLFDNVNFVELQFGKKDMRWH